MKHKRYIEPLWPLSIMFGILLCFCWAVFAFAISVISKDSIQAYLILIYIACFCLISTILFIIILPRILSTIAVKKNYIIWHCPFHKTVKILAEDCEYVGIVDSSESIRFRYDVQYAAYGMASRGDAMVYIYLSKIPFPQKYIHRAVEVHCKEGFIKFAYSDKLCLELLEVLPASKTSALRAFYNRMQAVDRVNKRKHHNKKKRKSKKK